MSYCSDLFLLKYTKYSAYALYSWSVKSVSGTLNPGTLPFLVWSERFKYFYNVWIGNTTGLGNPRVHITGCLRARVRVTIFEPLQNPRPWHGHGGLVTGFVPSLGILDAAVLGRCHHMTHSAPTNLTPLSYQAYQAWSPPAASLWSRPLTS